MYLFFRKEAIIDFTANFNILFSQHVPHQNYEFLELLRRKFFRAQTSRARALVHRRKARKKAS